jgi:hypothetical protein
VNTLKVGPPSLGVKWPLGRLLRSRRGEYNDKVVCAFDLDNFAVLTHCIQELAEVDSGVSCGNPTRLRFGERTHVGLAPDGSKGAIFTIGFPRLVTKIDSRVALM